MSGTFDKLIGSLTADVLSFNPDAIPEPDTLVIYMTRGEHRIADELRKQFGGFKRVVIDVDGERHEFPADSFIRLLESYEDASRYSELFGTPERAARTLAYNAPSTCDECVLIDICDIGMPAACMVRDHDALLEWLRG